MLNWVVDPIFAPLLKLPPFITIIIISFLIALLMTLIYKLMTNQELMKSLKQELKSFQNQMKEFKSEPKKVMEIQKKAMQVNMKYMMNSMKPTLVTFIPIIIIFSWLSANLAYEPIQPNQEFSTILDFKEGVADQVEIIVPDKIQVLNNKTQIIQDRKAKWNLKGDEGEYILEYTINNRKYSKDLLITNKQSYKNPVKNIKDDLLNTIKIENKKLTVINIFGWKLSWLWSYILCSLVFSISLRKIMKLH